MASGKLTPRQKMINMMYLVLTALLALNVSKEILDAFVVVERSLMTSVDKVENQNENIYAQFEAAMGENAAKAKEWNDKAQDVRAHSNDLYNYIQAVKEHLIEEVGGYDEEGRPLKMDNREIPANYLLVKEKKAYELKEKIDEFRNFLVATVPNNEGIINNLETIFNTDKVKNGDVKSDWEKATFEHYPLMAVVTFLTKMQADVRTAETDVISDLQTNIGKYDVKVNKLDATAIVPNSYVFTGDTFTAELFIAAFDTTKVPTVTIYNDYDEEGNPVGEGIQVPVKNGRGIYKVPAQREGVFTWGGSVEIQTPSGAQKFNVDPRTYQVAKSAAVISPTKMNVLYRGVDNPIDVSVPGISPSNLKVTCSGGGLSGSNGSFIVQPGDGEKAIISVSAVDEDGKTKNIGQMEFRIKRIPPPNALIAGKQDGKISKNALSGTQGIAAVLFDFPFDIQYKVTSFTVRAQQGGYVQTVRVQGNAFNQEVRSLIQDMKPGSDISFTNIMAKGPDGTKKCGAIVFTVQ